MKIKIFSASANNFKEIPEKLAGLEDQVNAFLAEHDCDVAIPAQSGGASDSRTPNIFTVTVWYRDLVRTELTGIAPPRPAESQDPAA